MNVTDFLNKLIADPTRQVSIKKQTKIISGFAEFRSINLGQENYFKIVFEDHSFLTIIPNQQMILYSDEPPATIREITNDDIGNKKEIIYKNKKFILDNPHDYQYVVRLIKGDFNSVEGEVRFSDYVPESGDDEILSLGIIVRTGERADMNPKKISLDEITLQD